MRERILAILGAVVLIGAAIAVRSVLTGDDDGAGPGGRTGTARPVVACAPDLKAVCEALVADGVITAAPGPLDLAGATDPDESVNGWITWDPAPAVVNFDRPETWSSEPAAVASARLGVLSSGSVQGCSSGATWAGCVLAAARAGRAVGVGNATTAQGLARLHPVARALVPVDGDFTTISAADLRMVVSSPAVGQDDQAAQITTFLTRRGALDLVVGADPALRTASARLSSAAVATPTPAESMTVVLATRAADGPNAADDPLGADLVLDSERARTALTGLGLEPGEGEVSDTARSGEFYAVLDKLR